MIFQCQTNNHHWNLGKIIGKITKFLSADQINPNAIGTGFTLWALRGVDENQTTQSSREKSADFKIVEGKNGDQIEGSQLSTFCRCQLRLAVDHNWLMAEIGIGVTSQPDLVLLPIG